MNIEEAHIVSSGVDVALGVGRRTVAQLFRVVCLFGVRSNSNLQEIQIEYQFLRTLPMWERLRMLRTTMF